jgi:hypothetical protein
MIPGLTSDSSPKVLRLHVMTSFNNALAFHELSWTVVGEIEYLLRDYQGTCSEPPLIIFDRLIKLEHLNPLYYPADNPEENTTKQSQGAGNEPEQYGALLARLVLAFPEALFIFPLSKDGDSLAYKAFQSTHGLGKLFAILNDPLFDGSGLRDWIRQQMRNKSKKKEMEYLPRRTKLAVALDEEADYAMLHAYTAYRFGFRAVPLSTKSQAQAVLGPASCWQAPELTFEDKNLNFPDAEGGYSTVDGKRKIDFCKLELAINRILATSGHGIATPEIKLPFTILDKPNAGMFQIWKETKLIRTLIWQGANNHIHRGVGDGFVWPPPWDATRTNSHFINVLLEYSFWIKEKIPQKVRLVFKKIFCRTDCKQESMESSGHSCSGILLVIAKSLLGRAERLLTETRSVADAVRGAVLATDALELLGGKTPTAAVEALTLKHQLEVLAECQFSGVEYHFPVKPRLDEIRRDLASFATWFHWKRSSRARLNAEMSIVAKLILIFREHAQFDEEQICMNRARNLHNTLWMLHHKWRFLLWLPIRYLELLLCSFGVFVSFLIIWILVLAALFYCVSIGNGGTVYTSLEDALTSFFSMGSPIHQDITSTASPATQSFMTSWYVGVICIAIVAGVVHLGIFISYLYSIVTRK